MQHQLKKIGKQKRKFDQYLENIQYGRLKN